MTSTDSQLAIQRTQQIFELLDQWGTSAEEKLQLLHMQDHVKARHLSRYRRGESLPDLEEIQIRMEHLLGIADALRTMHPLNNQMGAIWMNQRHRRFNERTPLQTMLEDDLDGIIIVRKHVDCSYDWQMDAERYQSLADAKKQ